MPSTISYWAIALALQASAASEVVPDPNRGLYAIWAKPEVSDALTFIKGDQVRLQWSEVQPAPDRYDFSSLRQQLERVAKLGRATTVQLNANRHPEFLSRIVPSYKGTLKRGESDKLFQYWHPAYVKAYTDLIAAFAREVKSSPYRAQVMGVRLNYDAIGTEFLIIRPEERDPAQWGVPAGVTLAPAWTEEIAAEYRRLIVGAFLSNFSPEIRVLLRSGNPSYPAPDEEPLRLAATGKLGIFTTASEIEPRMPTMFDGDRPIFLDYCRSGKTVCYAESMADATGKHGPSQDPRWCSPEQYNYWRLLSDLNLGFSMMGVYGADLANAGKPEYRAAFDFAVRYAGYHASPKGSPGAWIALREGSGKLKGDYTFLMRRLPGVEMKPEQKIGPDDQRFGAWARTLAKGSEAKFALDSSFARSLAGGRAILRVIYLDRGAGTFTVHAAGRAFSRTLASSGRWQTAEFKIDHADLMADPAGAHIAIQSTDDMTLHMIEVLK
jgi:hypothetical protein